MYDINTKNVEKGKRFFLIFLVAGIFFGLLLGGVYVAGLFKKSNLDSDTVSTRVEVRTVEGSDGDTLYTPDYYYRVKGTEYKCTSNSSSSIRPSTESKTVYYDSKNPEICMTSYSLSSNNFLLLAMIIPAIFIAVSVLNMRKISKRIVIIKELNQKGKLVKNLPYRLEDTGTVVNNVPIQRLVVDYTLPSGSVISLYGDPRYDKKATDADGMVDLVIDEANPDNYFIDFEINRLAGNQPTDYYNNPNGQVGPSTASNAVPVGSANPYNAVPQQAPMQPQMPAQQYDPNTGQPIQNNNPNNNHF